MVIITELKPVDTDAVIFTRLLYLCGNLKNQFKTHFRVYAGNWLILETT